LNRIFATLENLGVRQYASYNAQIIRGLDYYTAVVFEAYDLDGGRAILGGGHYDNLVAAVGGEQLPAVGFAMGDMMITIVLKKYGLLPERVTLADAVLVTVFDEDRLAASYSMAAELRKAGLKVICYPEVVKLPKQLKYADRVGIRAVVIIGPDEQANRQVVVKDLAARTQETVNRVEAAGILKQMVKQKLAKDKSV
jgi:histidyl-tRNA synthetase